MAKWFRVLVSSFVFMAVVIAPNPVLAAEGDDLGSGTIAVQATWADVPPRVENWTPPYVGLAWVRKWDGIEFHYYDSREMMSADFSVYPADGDPFESAAIWRGCSANTPGEHVCFIPAEPGSAVALRWFRASFSNPHEVTGCSQTYSEEWGWQQTCETVWSFEAYGYDNWPGSGRPLEAINAVAASPVISISTQSLDSAVAVSWRYDNSPAGQQAIGAVVTATPGDHTCETREQMSCVVRGLDNQHPYHFKIQPLLREGHAAGSEVARSVIPLTPGLQAWPQTRVLPLGASARLVVGNAPAGHAVGIRGLGSAAVIADIDGIAEASFTIDKPGVWVYVASYAAKVGRRTTLTKCTTRVFVPMFASPMTRIKPGKTGTIKVSFAPAGVPVEVWISDGRRVTATTDAAGKAVLSAAFPTRGAFTFAVVVEGQTIGNGGLTVY